MNRDSRLAVAISADLRRRIWSGELRPGDRLPANRELAASLGVSLGSVREAISMLIGDGLVETRTTRGTFVCGPGSRGAGDGSALERREVEELIEAREVIEPYLAAIAAERASAEDLARLRACLERMAAASDDPQAYPDAEAEFHLALADAGHNRFLRQWLTGARMLLRRDIELSVEAESRRFGDMSASVESQRKLVEAIEAGEPDRARQAALDIMWRNHWFVLGLYALAAAPAEPRPVTRT